MKGTGFVLCLLVFVAAAAVLVLFFPVFVTALLFFLGAYFDVFWQSFFVVLFPCM
jgi:hypothetical protein